MKKRSLVLFAIAAFLCAGFVHAKQIDLLAEANSKFRFNGKPIHPNIIDELSIGFGELDKGNISLDVAEKTKKYAGVKVNSKHGAYYTERDKMNYSANSYERIGTHGEVHILSEHSFGGGTLGASHDLVFVRFFINPEGKLMIQRVGGEAFGRKYYDLTIHGSKVMAVEKNNAGEVGSGMEISIPEPVSAP